MLRYLTIAAVLFPLVSPVLTLSAADRKFVCVPTHVITCVNQDLPLYREGCQTETEREGPLTLTLDLDNEEARYCYKSDGECLDEQISVDLCSPRACYLTRGTSHSVDLRHHGVLNLESLTYGESKVDWGADNSLIAPVAFYRCVPAK
jgi:hypothetical protein